MSVASIRVRSHSPLVVLASGCGSRSFCHSLCVLFCSYIRIARYGQTTAGEPCGTDDKPGDGTGCKGGPSSFSVCGVCGILSDSSYPTGGALVNGTM